MNYLFHILILINIYIILGLSLNLLAGYTGLLSLCHAAFFGTGAYITAILSLKLGMPWFVTVILGILFTSLLATIVGWASLRFRDDYFVIATFGFQIIILSIMKNWNDLTNGMKGLPGIPQPVILGWQINSHSKFLLLSFFFTAITVFIIRRLSKSPYGKVLRAIREDEIFTQSIELISKLKKS